MSPRTGRPKVDNPKDKDLKVRIDAATLVLLDEYCATHEITRAEAVRQGIHLLLAKEK